MAEYLNFMEQPNPGKKTRVFHVYNRTQPGSQLLGIVYFRPGWRKYGYESGNSFYDVGCLQEIAVFVQKLMDERKA